MCGMPATEIEQDGNSMVTTDAEGYTDNTGDNANPNTERVSDDEIKRAEAILEKAKKQNIQLQYQNYQQVKS